MPLSGIRRKLLLAPVLQNPGRLAMSLAAIALGVALGYAVQLVNGAALDEFRTAVQVLSGEADLTIGGSRSGFDEALYPRVARLPEVAVASPVIEVEAKIPGQRDSLKVLGLDVLRAARIQPFLAAADIADRMDLLRPDRLFLSAAAARSLGLKAGDALPVQVGLSVISLRVAGILEGAGRERFAVVDIGAAQVLFARPGLLNRIDLRLRPGTDAERFAGRLRAGLPAGLLVERPDAEVDRNASMSRAYRVNLNVLALVALFTGGLLVFSAQALAVVRRRAQLALLRALGVTQRGLVTILLAEAAIVGAAGSLIGVLLGYAVAAGVLRRFGAELGAGYFRGIDPVLVPDPLALVLFFCLGVIAAVLGTLAPALEAARADPATALRAGDEASAFDHLRPAWPGISALVAGAALTQAGPVGGLPLFGYAAIALLLIGCVLLMPRIALACFRALPARGPAVVQVGLAQLRGAAGAVGVSLAAVVASVSLIVSMAIMVASFRQSLDQWLERVLPADLYVRAGSGGNTAFFSPADQQALAALPGVRRAEFMRSQRLVVAPDRPAIALLARAVEAEGRLPPLLGAARARRPGDPPSAWVSEIAAEVYGWRTGDTIMLPLGGREARFIVAGVWRDYARQQGAVLIERYEYLRYSGDANANDLALWLAPGAEPANVRAGIEARAGAGVSLEITGPGEIRDVSLGIFDRTFAVTYALEAVALVIGVCGLSSGFGALVLARRREFGMLRHLGMTRRQIGAMLAMEGALVSALGLVVGLALGCLISLVLIHVVNRQSFHWSMELYLPWRLLAEFVIAMLLVATLTAVASGRRAMSGEAVRAVKEDW